MTRWDEFCELWRVIGVGLVIKDSPSTAGAVVTGLMWRVAQLELRLRGGFPW